jgi:aminodeoxyfutalosine synthase
MLGVKIAQVAQSWGADDIDGTVVHEKIYHAAGSDSPQELSVAELRWLIEEAGRVPVERDTLYHEVVRPEAAARRWQTGRRVVTLQ